MGGREIYKKAELSQNDHIDLKESCENHNVEFLTSIFNIKHLGFLESLKMDSIKIPSHEIHNTNLISKAQDNFNNILLSAGACTFKELLKSIELIPKNKLILMHCVSSYPLPLRM